MHKESKDIYRSLLIRRCSGIFYPRKRLYKIHPSVQVCSNHNSHPGLVDSYEDKVPSPLPRQPAPTLSV